jgi:hypothetical protein
MWVGNNPINQVDPDGGYSKFGAWWRSGFSNDIYQSGYTEDGSREVWGYNKDGVSHFGDDAGSFWKTASALQSQNILDRASAVVNAQSGIPSSFITGNGIEPFNLDVDALLLVTTAGIGNAAKAGISATARARSLGAAGEAAAGITGKKTAIQVAGRTRIPDALTESALTEVKNVASLSYTRQLRDFHKFASETGRDFILYTRPNTTLSGPLRNAIKQGDIILKPIPGLK